MKKLSLNKIWYAFAGVLFLIFIFQLSSRENTSSTENGQSWSGIDTFIPKDFRLIPIQITNIDKVSHLVAETAYVDLFKPNARDIIAQGLRLIKSPIADSTFAVLVPHEQVKNILKNGDEFFIVIRGRDEPSQNSPRSNKKSRIVWEDI